MFNEFLLYIGSIIVFIWGIAHLVPTKNVVKGFGEISFDNKMMITMEWIAAGLTLCFVGLSVFLITYLGYAENVVSILIFRLFSILLFTISVVHMFTGFRTKILPNKLCPIILTIVGILFLIYTF